jgi:glycosyltransferase involved in cell wall biosynthesis
LLAFAKALALVPHAKLVMIGDGPLMPVVQRLVSALHLEEHVRLDGARDHLYIVQTLKNASVFMQHSVIASDGDREGTPVAVLEAAAAGIPVVATRPEGIAEVVETGLLVEEGDIDGMGDALVEMLSNPSRARRLGEEARRRVKASYSLELSMERLGEILEGAISQSDQTRG